MISLTILSDITTRVQKNKSHHKVDFKEELT